MGRHDQDNTYRLIYSHIYIIVGQTLQHTTTDLQIILNHLQKYQNYTVQVAALTRKGEGVRSLAVYCRTKEDGKMNQNQ